MDSDVFRTYLQYLTATRLYWYLSDKQIDYATTKNDLLAAFGAVKESKLEILHILLKDDSMNDPECLDALTHALTHHTTLQMIMIGGKVSNYVNDEANQTRGEARTNTVDIAFVELISHSKPINTDLDDGPLNNEEFNALLRILQSNKQLQVFKIMYSLTNEQMSLVVPELFELPSLEEISLGSMEQLDESVLISIGSYVDERPHIKYNFDYDAQDLIKSCLNESKTAPNARNSEMTESTSEEYPLNIYLPNLDKPFIELLPTDVIKLILNQLSVQSLLHFTMTNKSVREVCTRAEFWRDYYLHHFDNIPQDIMEVISILHGETLSQVNSVKQVTPTWNIWLSALRHMPQLYTGPRYSSFPHNISDLRTEVERRWPQFIGSHMGAISDRDADALDTAWFMKHLNDDTGRLKLGFHQNKTGVYSGILLLGEFYEDHTSRVGVWEMIDFILDWKTASSREELLDKCKDMCEAFILLHYRANWNDKYTLYFRTISPSASRTHKLLADVQNHINTVIDTCAENICASLAQQDSHKLNQVISSKLDQLKMKPIVNLILPAQRLKKRSEFNRKYWKGNEWLSFHDAIWEPEDILPAPKKVNQDVVHPESSPRPSKAIPKVLLLRFIRTTLNFIVMPILTMFWPRDMTDEDSNHYAYFIDYVFREMYQERYGKNYTPLEKLTVTSASPHCWPVIALAVAKLIIADICDVIEEWITRQMTDSWSTSESKVSDLTDSLTRLNLLSAAHLKHVKELFSAS